MFKYTPVPLNDVFLHEGALSSSEECLEWSPHNVLAVAGKHTVKLFTSNLWRPASTLTPVLHRAAPRGKKDEEEAKPAGPAAPSISSVSWSPSLVEGEENTYPASALLCVSTESSVTIYRVRRRGNQVHTSGGTEFFLPPMSSAPASSSPASSRSSSASSSSSTSSSSFPYSSSSSDYSSSSSSSWSSMGGAKRRRKRKASKKTKEERKFTRSTLPAERRRLRLIKVRRPDSLRAMMATVPKEWQKDPPVTPTVLSANWLRRDRLVVVSTLGIHLLDASKLEHSNTLTTLSLPNPLCTYSRQFPMPMCVCVPAANQHHATAATSAMADTLVCAVPNWLFLLMATDDTDGTHVRCVARVHVPSMTGCPSAISCVACNSPSMQKDLCVVTVYVTAGSTTLIGVFECSPISVGQSASASVASPVADLVWQLKASLTPEHFQETDCFFRGFKTIPAFPHTSPTQIHQSHRQQQQQQQQQQGTHDALAIQHTHLVWGVTMKSVCCFQTGGIQTRTVFRALNMSAHVASGPEDGMLRLGALAVHPSLMVAVLSGQTKRSYGTHTCLCVHVAGSDPSLLRQSLHFNAGSVDPTGGGDAGGMAMNDSAHQAAASDTVHDVAAILRHFYAARPTSDAFFWETLFADTANSFSVATYHNTRGALALPAELPPLTSAQGSASTLSGTPGPAAWRDAYLAARTSEGLDMFLRHSLHHAGSRRNLSTTAEAAAPLRWFELLRLLRRSIVADSQTILELTLGSAVWVLACRLGYRNVKLHAGHQFATSGAAAGGAFLAVDLSTLSSDGALAFVQAYVRRGEEVLSGGSGVVDARNWIFSREWLDTVKNFASLAAERIPDAATLFACSVCAAPCSCSLSVELTATCFHKGSTTVDVAPPQRKRGSSPKRAQAADPPDVEAKEEEHTTIFSPQLFAPLSVVSSTCEWSRCSDCAVADYPSGPFCFLCGGAMR